jgi:thiol:disulfide interchange protein
LTASREQKWGAWIVAVCVPVSVGIMAFSPNKTVIGVTALSSSVLLAGWWIAFAWRGKGAMARDFAIAGSATLVALGGLVAVVSIYAAELPWQPYTRVALEQHRRQGRTVLVDFTADWCATCKVNEATAFNVLPTYLAVNNNGVVALKADKTKSSPEIDALLTELGNEGRSIPYCVIYPADGSPPIKLDGPLTFWHVLSALRDAGPSQPRPDDAATAALP